MYLPRITLIFVATGLACATHSLAIASAAPSIKEAHTRFYDSQAIRTVSSYLGADQPRQLFRTVVPSDPSDPSGYYFILSLDRKQSNAFATAHLEYISTDSKEVRTAVWSIGDAPLTNWLYLGLTGKDWPQRDQVHPLAWRIELRNSENQTIAEWSSFLWELD